MMPALHLLFLFLGGLILIVGLIKLVFVPLALVFEVGQERRRRRRTPGYFAEPPLVSVVIPGYNEELVLNNCVRSVLASDYPLLEVILVDDGSSDATATIMGGFAQRHPHVSFIGQDNAGKGAALNRGMATAKGEVLMFVDADGVFEPHTVSRMVEAFQDAGVGAVCGDDRPVNLNRVQTRLLAMISHVGTGLVRRALTVLGCMPIVSGNVGAFRRDVLALTGPFDEETIGEDLELTWRVHRAGYQVRFAPRAIVHAESPSTLRGLWKQRVRWARGLLQTTSKHRTMVANPRYGTFGWFLLFNTISMIVVPVAQILALILLAVLGIDGQTMHFPEGFWAWMGFLGALTAVLLLVYAMALNRSLGDLRHAWTLPLWPPYALFVGLTMLAALWKQARREPARWNKLERTGVASVGWAASDRSVAAAVPVGYPSQAVGDA